MQKWIVMQTDLIFSLVEVWVDLQLISFLLELMESWTWIQVRFRGSAQGVTAGERRAAHGWQPVVRGANPALHQHPFWDGKLKLDSSVKPPQPLT